MDDTETIGIKPGTGNRSDLKTEIPASFKNRKHSLENNLKQMNEKIGRINLMAKTLLKGNTILAKRVTTGENTSQERNNKL